MQRLRTLARMIPRGSRVAEIGTDHGLLPRRLLGSGRAAYCIATELGERSLVRLRRLREGDPHRERLELRAGDGLSVLRETDRIDVLVLAGLGASRICSILAGGPRAGRDRPRELGVRRLVLQPQTEPALLRGWLVRHGWEIVAEAMASERGRFYVVLAAEPSGAGALREHPSLSAEDLLEAGPCLVRSSDERVRRYWQERLELFDDALEMARSPAGRERLRASRDRARRVLEALPADLV